MLNSIVNTRGAGALVTTKKFPNDGTHCLQSLCDRLVENMGVVQYQVIASITRYMVKKKIVDSAASAPKSLAKLVQRCLLSIFENQLPLRALLFGLDDQPLQLKQLKRRRAQHHEAGGNVNPTTGPRLRSASQVADKDSGDGE